VDDAAAGSPEADAVLRADRAEEVVHLPVRVDRDAHVDLGADLGGDQVIAVDGRRDRGGGQAGGHELQQRHLCGCVLHGDTIGCEVVVRLGPLDLLVLGREVVEEDLLSQRERTAELLPATLDAAWKSGVDAFHQFDRGAGAGDAAGRLVARTGNGVRGRAAHVGLLPSCFSFRCRQL
jgi:hypothetical protein